VKKIIVALMFVVLAGLPVRSQDLLSVSTSSSPSTWSKVKLDLRTNTQFQLVDTLIPAMFYDVKNHQWLYGSVSPLVVYRNFISADMGAIVPTGSSKGTLALGSSLKLTEPVHDIFNVFFNSLPGVRDHLKVVEKAVDYTSFGTYGAYDFDINKPRYGVYAGVRVAVQ